VPNHDDFPAVPINTFTTPQSIKMCFGGRRGEDEYKKSREIDAMIHRDEKEMAKVVKLLLLGKPPLCDSNNERATWWALAARNT
jgi:hypothetical protein